MRSTRRGSRPSLIRTVYTWWPGRLSPIFARFNPEAAVTGYGFGEELAAAARGLVDPWRQQLEATSRRSTRPRGTTLARTCPITACGRLCCHPLVILAVTVCRHRPLTTACRRRLRRTCRTCPKHYGNSAQSARLDVATLAGIAAEIDRISNQDAPIPTDEILAGKAEYTVAKLQETHAGHAMLQRARERWQQLERSQPAVAAGLC